MLRQPRSHDNRERKYACAENEISLIIERPSFARYCLRDQPSIATRHGQAARGLASERL